MSVNLASTAATVGLWTGSSSQHCCIRSTSLESMASTLEPGGTRGRNGGVSPLRTRPTTSVQQKRTFVRYSFVFVSKFTLHSSKVTTAWNILESWEYNWAYHSNNYKQRTEHESVVSTAVFAVNAVDFFWGGGWGWRRPPTSDCRPSNRMRPIVVYIQSCQF